MKTLKLFLNAIIFTLSLTSFHPAFAGRDGGGGNTTSNSQLREAGVMFIKNELKDVRWVSEFMAYRLEEEINSYLECIKSNRDELNQRKSAKQFKKESETRTKEDIDYEIDHCQNSLNALNVLFGEADINGANVKQLVADIKTVNLDIKDKGACFYPDSTVPHEASAIRSTNTICISAEKMAEKKIDEKNVLKEALALFFHELLHIKMTESKFKLYEKEYKPGNDFEEMLAEQIQKMIIDVVDAGGLSEFSTTKIIFKIDDLRTNLKKMETSLTQTIQLLKSGDSLENKIEELRNFAMTQVLWQSTNLNVLDPLTFFEEETGLLPLPYYMSAKMYGVRYKIGSTINAATRKAPRYAVHLLPSEFNGASELSLTQMFVLFEPKIRVFYKQVLNMDLDSDETIVETESNLAFTHQMDSIKIKKTTYGDLTTATSELVDALSALNEIISLLEAIEWPEGYEWLRNKKQK